MRPTLEQYRTAAKRMYHDEGTVEVDDRAPISRGDDTGAYVQAWVWVSDEDAVCTAVGFGSGNHRT